MERDEQGYDDGFDYSGKDMVAIDRRMFHVAPGKTGRGYEGGAPIGEASLGEAAEGALDGIARRAGAKRGSLEAMRLWRKMGDRRLRDHTRAVFLGERRWGKELAVYVDSPGWAQEFQMLSPSYLVEWNHLCEAGRPEMRAGKMTFRVSSRAGSSSEGGAGGGGGKPSEEPQAVPLDAEELARVEEAVSVIHDDALRRKAYDAMKSVLEWQKSKDSHKAQTSLTARLKAL